MIENDKKITDVYILENLHGINYFLSEVKDNDNELIILGIDVSAKTFLKKILKNVNYLYVQKEWYSFVYEPELEKGFQILKNLKSQIYKIMKSVELAQDCKLHTYHMDINPYKFYLIDYFDKNNYIIFHEDLFGTNPICKIKLDLNDKEKAIINYFLEEDNMHVEWIANPTYNALRMVNKFKKNDAFKLLSWAEIINHFKITIQDIDITAKRVLLIDDIFEENQLNIKETKNNLTKLFLTLKNNNYTIYIKEHYRSNFSTKDIINVDNVIFINKFLPIELLIPCFNKSLILSYASSSLISFYNNNKQCFFIVDFINFKEKKILEDRIKVAKKISNEKIPFLSTVKEIEKIL